MSSSELTATVPARVSFSSSEAKETSLEQDQMTYIERLKVPIWTSKLLTIQFAYKGGKSK